MALAPDGRQNQADRGLADRNRRVQAVFGNGL
jgi:hypothetical protein